MSPKKVHFVFAYNFDTCQPISLFSANTRNLQQGDNCIGLSRYIAITNLPIISVFVDYLRQFLIDLNQTYRHSSVPKTRLREFFSFLAQAVSEQGAAATFFCHVVPVTV